MASLLRFGRGVDNRLFKATGFRYGYTSRETADQLGEHLRLEPILRGERARTATTTRARSRSSCAGARTCAASADGDGVAADREPLGI